MKVAVVGVTGLVGGIMCKVLEEQHFPVSEFIPVASERSVGKEVVFQGRSYEVVGMEEAIARRPDIALFSAGGGTSLEWAPRFAEVGTTVVDNSSAWRMDPAKKLVVPEINAHVLGPDDRIIANPNCSTIQMVLVLAPLHREFQMKRVVVSTYQSITGTGMKAVKQYQLERKGFDPQPDEMAYPYQILENCLPQCDAFLENAYTKEEMKLVNETRKILGDDQIRITSTAVRVPVLGGHSESVNVEFAKPVTPEQARDVLRHMPGVIVMDDPATHQYPMPMLSKDRDEVFVGRIRQDDSVDHGLNLWIVADNLRKGAATNAVQIARYLLERHLVGAV
ncbi:MAG: aspartate-semialdehyde dehydrogenase [Haliscomenobacter sp.]|nr:aspartate-semialdehyde dehydrogenase [Haliscomenobacter sp.]MBK8652719.1 aspartate-semialdehyde dehydrogenase [Haliscomenobacter sp.]MBP9077759.1 aspartate-semialdehyde dehydrogenase [Haliscomenobacter sp.]MBP9873587.1 aspartate-semialdehyde dehydrogenase [Haliscomenobacter sp.]